jgi:hypothetical protein
LAEAITVTFSTAVILKDTLAWGRFKDFIENFRVADTSGAGETVRANELIRES